MKINEVAKRTGITVRTLQYYDEIGLLTPSEVNGAGYRIYNEESLEILQQILFFRELDFPLAAIKEIMANPGYDKTEALLKQKELLLQKRNRLDGLIELLEGTIRGDKNMSFQEFDQTAIEANMREYVAEVKERWGNTDAFKQSEKKTASYDANQWEMRNRDGVALLKSFGDNRHILPDSEPAQELVKRWQAYITDCFYECTNEILSCLGLMYVGDERFRENIDKNGEGTAAFMAAAIEIYCKK